jgi:hypothetical protein
MTIILALWTALQLQEETVQIPGSPTKFTLVRLPGGAARVGDEKPREAVLPPFWIGKHEVTWEEYSLYYESHKQFKVDGITRPTQPDVIDPKEPFPNGADQGPKHPAISVGWYGAMGYCEWLSKKTGHAYRLPTEVEWEYACRATGELPPLDQAAWHQGNADAQSHEVGGKKPNSFGLFDTLGNAWENVLEPHAPPALRPVVRGGGWNTPAADVRPGKRQPVPDEWADRDPKRPLRLWWLTDGNFVTLRVVRLEGGDAKAEAEAASKIAFKNVKLVEKGKRPDFHDRVRGELSYSGTKPLEELEILVHFLDEDGKPMLKDPKDKPAFNYAWPALASSWHDGPHRKPMQPGETRAFEIEVPHPFVEAGPLDLDGVAARVTRVRLGK